MRDTEQRMKIFTSYSLNQDWVNYGREVEEELKTNS